MERIITAHQRSWGKVMFSQFFVCPKAGVGISGTRSLPGWVDMSVCWVCPGDGNVQEGVGMS